MAANFNSYYSSHKNSLAEKCKDTGPDERDLKGLCGFLERSRELIDEEIATILADVILNIDHSVSAKTVHRLLTAVFNGFPFFPKVISSICNQNHLHPELYCFDYGKATVDFIEEHFPRSSFFIAEDGSLMDLKRYILLKDTGTQIFNPKVPSARVGLCDAVTSASTLLWLAKLARQRSQPTDIYFELLDSPLFAAVKDEAFLQDLAWERYAEYEIDRFKSSQPFERSAGVQNKPRLNVCLVLWGDQMTKLCDDHALRSFFSSANLKSLSQNFNLQLNIITKCDERLNFTVKCRLKIPRKLAVKFHFFEDYKFNVIGSNASPDRFNYRFSNLAQNIFVQDAQHHSASIIFLTPDAVFSDHVGKLIVSESAKQRMIFVQCPRTILENINSATLKTSDKALAEHLANNLHPSNFYYSNLHDSVFGLPGMFVEIRAKKLEFRTLHPHPLFIPYEFLKNSILGHFNSIDGDLSGSLYDAAGGRSKNYSDLVFLHTDLMDPVMVDLTSSTQQIEDVSYSIDEALADNRVKNFTNSATFFHLLSFAQRGTMQNCGYTPKSNNSHLKKLASHFNSFKQSYVPLINTWQSKAVSQNECGHISRLIKDQIKPIPKIVFFGCIWGESYLKDFCDFSFPSFIGALAAAKSRFSDSFETNVLICTDQTPDSDHISSIKRVAQESDVEITFQSIEEITTIDKFDTKYLALMDMQIYAMRKYSSGDYICFLYGDFIWSKNSVCTIFEKLLAKPKLIAQFIPQVQRQKFLFEFSSRAEFKTKGGEVVAVRCDETTLVDLVKSSLHDLVRTSIYNRDGFNPVGPYFILNDASDNMLVRSFHLHPIVLSIPERLEEVSSSFDEEFIAENFNLVDADFIDNTDECCICSLEDADKPIGPPAPARLKGFREWQEWYLNWIEAGAGHQHRALFLKEITFGNFNASVEGDKIKEFSRRWTDLIFYRMGLSLTDLEAFSRNNHFARYGENAKVNKNSLPYLTSEKSRSEFETYMEKRRQEELKVISQSEFPKTTLVSLALRFHHLIPRPLRGLLINALPVRFRSSLVAHRQ